MTPARAAAPRATSRGFGSTRHRSRSPTDADGEPLSFLWDLGDGVTRAGEKVLHAYTEPGEYAVRLGVADGTGLSCGQASDEIKVSVQRRG
jgi:PKD repeat protein